MPRVTTLVPLTALLLSAIGCSRSAAPAAGDTAHVPAIPAFPAESALGAAATPAPATPAPAAAGSGGVFDLCRILPADSVARVLQQAMGKSVSVAVSRAGGMCTYRDEPADAPTVRVSVDVGQLQSPASAGATLFALRAQVGTSGIAATDLPGIGDAAFGSSDTTGSYGVQAQSGAFMVHVTVNAPGVAPAALRAGATALTRRTVTMLH